MLFPLLFETAQKETYFSGIRSKDEMTIFINDLKSAFIK